MTMVLAFTTAWPTLSRETNLHQCFVLLSISWAVIGSAISAGVFSQGRFISEIDDDYKLACSSIAAIDERAEQADKYQFENRSPGSVAEGVVLMFTPGRCKKTISRLSRGGTVSRVAVGAAGFTLGSGLESDGP